MVFSRRQWLLWLRGRAKATQYQLMDHGFVIESVCSFLREHGVAQAAQERQLSSQAALHVASLHPDPLEPPEPAEFDTVFAPADHTEPDTFADQYEATIEQIVAHLGPKLRME